MPELIASQRREVLAATEARASGAAVAGIGSALPAEVLPNASIAERLGVDEDWIVARTGVRERRIAAPGERLSAYAARAGANALDAAGLAPGELDLLLVATMSHEQLTPSAAPLVAAEIGADRAAAIDIGAACTGFVSALSLAAAQIESGRARSALIVGADLLSRMTDRDDRSTAGLFGDGAGAAVLLAVDPPGRLGPVVLGADGGNGALITAGREEGLIRMKGPDTFRHAVDRLSEVSIQALAAAGQTIEEIELFVYHQANSRIISAVGERLGLSPERVIDCVPSFGNTSAASIPIALAEAERTGMLSQGTKVLLAAFGGGLTWGACALEWGAPNGS
jgi:3-oxoacyl-[acyl-carrier-protein] synthase III